MHPRAAGGASRCSAPPAHARNAQVAMFQAGEVDWLCRQQMPSAWASNLDVDHVAFGRPCLSVSDARDVDDAELAQIAGRRRALRALTRLARSRRSTCLRASRPRSKKYITAPIRRRCDGATTSSSSIFRRCASRCTHQ
jgi:hypothetical protein